MNKLFKRTIIEAENSDLNLNEIVGGVGPDYCPCNIDPMSYSKPPCIMDCACLTTLINCPCNNSYICSAHNDPCSTVLLE